ncbi:MAG: hypothetical protein IJG68_01990 [Bacilli bacterium]|nr:hypothetical protein [Bacilli bacterium]
MDIIIAKDKTNGKTLPFGTHGNAVQVEYKGDTTNLSAALSSIEDEINTIPIHIISTITACNIYPNRYYKFINFVSAELRINCVTDSITTKVNEFTFTFATTPITGRTPSLVINHPNTIKWINGTAPTLNINKTYIISIFDTYGIWIELDN